MTRRLLAVLALGALVAAPAVLPAQGSTSILLSAGLSLPVSDLANTFNSGYNVNLGLNFGAPVVPVGARLEAGVSSFDRKSGSGNVRIASGTANAIFNLGPTSAAPYLIGGLGIYNRRFSDQTIFGSTVTQDKTQAGINVGGGLRFPLTGISTFLEVRYHAMLGNAGDRTNYQYVPITFGVQF
jgi:hypothetical protein